MTGSLRSSIQAMIDAALEGSSVTACPHVTLAV